MNKAICREIFARFQAQMPHPKTELVYHSPFELLIAVMLSAQSTDLRVNLVTKTLFAKANTPESFLALGLEALQVAIKSIGLYRNKAANIMKTCAILVEQHQSQVPATREALEALPGVGRKTANVILNTAFGQATIAVDTHLFRVANRIGLAKGKTVLEVETKLLKIIPSEFLANAHHWLVLHGRYVCIARKPRCGECIIRDLCEYPHKTAAADNDP
jgi:endonuclease-3